MKRISSLILFFSLALNTFFILNRFILTQNTDNNLPADYPYLSKRIFVEEQNDILINFIPLREAMRNYIEKQNVQIGVYFEYLPSGTSIGVNEKMEVRLASLIKIPVVMAVYKQIERGRINKNQLLTVSEMDINKDFGDLWKRGIGTKITVDEAVRLSLIDSDNTATRTLVSALPKGVIDEVFDSLDIPKNTNNGLPVISPKNYTSILRSLYLSSFLTKKDSNEILAFLAETHFNDKLPAGIDQQVKVAHKIGEFDLPNEKTIFSDCGIIYPPDRPYALCIMIESSETDARKHMIHLSKMAFGYITLINK